MTARLQNQTSTPALRKVISAAAMGNFVEWFDFAVYGFLATIIASQFFPSDSVSLGLLKTFGVFAVAFAMRPLGGIFFGVLGDRLGRKGVLSLTILLMSGATTLIGLLPTHASWGVTAAVLLTFLRCLQGFSAGGEYAGSIAYVMEHAPSDKRGWYGSFIPVSTFMAFASAALLVFALESSLSSQVMAAWGWRVPFLLAAPLGLVGLYLRWRMEETPAFKAMAAEDNTHAHSPLRETLKSQSRSMLRLGAFISLTALSFYMFTTYFSTFLQVEGGLTRSRALLVTMIALVFAALFCPVAGRISDRIGRRNTIRFVCAWLFVMVVPAYLLASSGALWKAIPGVLLLAIGALTANVVTATLLSESFPTRTRYTASAFTYNVSYTIFGGTAPLMATWLIDTTGNNLAPALYLMVIAVLAGIGGLALRETSRISLMDDTAHQPDADLPPYPARQAAR
ncbi:MFS transporter, MHS family, proline/betaine transporter [Paracoccus alcaliphilus]|uniref:MFS transporter, MHS family, proline/betaine transporter n=1 Tax=Paracoccus alcaliphilus TaxID=34002 RepID=A0A1H8MHF4_9RHOB|nr:MFS transporter [Paracoccus alcaliphilus]WCR18672.1 MFS transporter [Paracoccus alcaliphilus]SEO16815.1 MFS transporter, MHS family, proline/betaine transporter [Paracoccus alcaliphilus]